METFLMSNISPQKAELNRGVWQKLEAAILNNYPVVTTNVTKGHVWVIVGPIIAANASFLTRDNGTKVSIPESFFCILVRPKRYPFDSPGNADYLAVPVSQTVSASQALSKTFLVSVDEIEAATGLNFFPQFSDLMEERIERSPAVGLW